MTMLNQLAVKASLKVNGLVVKGIRKARRFHQGEKGALTAFEIIVGSLITVLLGIAVYIVFKDKIDALAKSIFDKLQNLN